MNNIKKEKQIIIREYYNNISELNKVSSWVFILIILSILFSFGYL